MNSKKVRVAIRLSGNCASCITDCNNDAIFLLLDYNTKTLKVRVLKLK